MSLNSKLPVKKRRNFSIKEIHEYNHKAKLDTYDIIRKFQNKIIDENISSKIFDVYDLEYNCTAFISTDPNLYRMAKNLVVIRYKTFELEELKNESFMVIDISGLIYFIGHNTGIEYLKNFFSQELEDISDEANTRQFYFKSEFLLWMFLKCKKKDFRITDPLIIRSIRRTEIKRTSQSTKPIPLLMTVLLDLEINYTISMNYMGYIMKILIKNLKKVGIRSSGFRQFSYLERFVIGIYILNNFIKIQNLWELPGVIKDKDIDQIEIDKLMDECQNNFNLMLYDDRIRKIFNPK